MATSNLEPGTLNLNNKPHMREPKEPDDFLSCDWGTSSFRLRWVSGPELRVVREIREPAGVKSLHDEAAQSGATKESARAELFARFLTAKLGALLDGQPAPNAALPLVISGMASSSMGWKELPYAKVPFLLDGSGLRSEEIIWNKPSWVGPTFLISGIATDYDIMRGEETQIIGLMSDPTLAQFRRQSLLILPGTHSKHVWIEHETVTGFRTFMTGELFDLLGRHSILRASVDLDAGAAGGLVSDSDRAAFQEGARWGAERGMAAALFRVRTRAVLDRRPISENTWFLSGLLIGAELESVRRNAERRPVILGASGGLSNLYKLALEVVAPPTIQWIQLSPEIVEGAVIAAHAIFLESQSA